ncbi:helix-turn-helix transcriptional regulator [Bacillaceae bacterium Marseille-Q3522]|nr:helix-turn-helix transcriptional regulator [Bacillaceae bacterium Marseille-Q3522]
MSSLGERIRSLRKKQGLTMSSLAKEINCSSGLISDWENNNKTPSAPMLIALSQFFQVSVDWILKGTSGKEHDGKSGSMLISETEGSDSNIQQITLRLLQKIGKNQGNISYLEKMLLAFEKQLKEGDGNIFLTALSGEEKQLIDMIRELKEVDVIEIFTITRMKHDLRKYFASKADQQPHTSEHG